MPLDQYEWIDKRRNPDLRRDRANGASYLIERGVRKIRLTGGEPLVRQDMHLLIENLSQLEGLKDLCLTTNGVALRG